MAADVVGRKKNKKVDEQGAESLQRKEKEGAETVTCKDAGVSCSGFDFDNAISDGEATPRRTKVLEFQNVQGNQPSGPVFVASETHSPSSSVRDLPSVVPRSPELVAFGRSVLYRIWDKQGREEFVSFPSGLSEVEGSGEVSEHGCCSCSSGNCSACYCARSKRPCVSCEPNRRGHCVNKARDSDREQEKIEISCKDETSIEKKTEKEIERALKNEKEKGMRKEKRSEMFVNEVVVEKKKVNQNPQKENGIDKGLKKKKEKEHAEKGHEKEKENDENKIVEEQKQEKQKIDNEGEAEADVEQRRLFVLKAMPKEKDKHNFQSKSGQEIEKSELTKVERVEESEKRQEKGKAREKQKEGVMNDKESLFIDKENESEKGKELEQAEKGQVLEKRKENGENPLSSCTSTSSSSSHDDFSLCQSSFDTTEQEDFLHRRAIEEEREGLEKKQRRMIEIKETSKIPAEKEQEVNQEITVDNNENQKHLGEKFQKETTNEKKDKEGEMVMEKASEEQGPDWKQKGKVKQQTHKQSVNEKETRLEKRVKENEFEKAKEKEGKMEIENSTRILKEKGKDTLQKIAQKKDEKEKERETKTKEKEQREEKELKKKKKEEMLEKEKLTTEKEMPATEKDVLKFKGSKDDADELPAKGFICPHCARIFETRRGLSQHARVHSRAGEVGDLSDLEQGVAKWERLFAARAVTMKHVPSSLRNSVMEVLSWLLSRVVEKPESETRWWLLFAFPKLCLRMPERGGKKEKRRETSSVATRLQKAKENKWRELWEELKCEEERRQKRGRFQRREQEGGISKKLRKRVIDLVEEGRYAKACRALEDIGLHDLTPEVVDQLALKHPQVDPAAKLRGTGAFFETGLSNAVWVVEKETVKKALLAFSRGTGAGASGWRAEHLKEAVRAPLAEEGENILVPLTKVVNILLAGKAPIEIAPWVAGAPLYPLKKKDGGVRPIAVGEIFRRLVSRAVCLSPGFEDLCKELFVEGNQAGVGVKGGAEAVVHAARYCLQSNPGHLVLKFDFVNAFNAVSRNVVRHEVAQKCPKILPWLDFCYGEAAILRCEDISLPFQSRVGVQQGDSLGPFLFALALNTVTKRLKSLLSAGKAFWYLDDGIVVGSKDDVVTAWFFLKEEGEKIGLVLNESKCELFAKKLEDLNGIPGGMKRCVGCGFDILGSPVGEESFCDEYVAKRVEKIKFGIRRLELIDDPQIEATLIRSCLGMPKFGFALRSAPFCQIRSAVAAFDEVIDEALRNRLGLDVGMDQMEQARLPVGKGGLGFVRGEDVACSAFVASSFDSFPIMEGLLGESLNLENVPGLRETYEMLRKKCDAEALPVQVEDAWKSDLKKTGQKGLTARVMEKRAKDWLGRASSKRELVRRKAVMRKDSQLGAVGNWMNMVPAKWAGSKLAPVEFVKAIRWWLGVSVCQKGASSLVDSRSELLLEPEAGALLGDHAVMDPKGPYRIARHDRVNKTWCALLKRAGYEAELEKGVETDRKTRAADSWVEEWKEGKSAAHDWVIAHALQKDVVEGKVADVESLLKGAEHKKMVKEKDACESRDVLFVPLAMDTLCGFGDQARSAIIQVAMQSRLRCRDLTASFVAGSLRVAMLKGLTRQLQAHDVWEEEEEEVLFEG